MSEIKNESAETVPQRVFSSFLRKIEQDATISKFAEPLREALSGTEEISEARFKAILLPESDDQS